MTCESVLYWLEGGGSVIEKTLSIRADAAAVSHYVILKLN